MYKIGPKKRHNMREVMTTDRARSTMYVRVHQWVRSTPGKILCLFRRRTPIQSNTPVQSIYHYTIFLLPCKLDIDLP